MRLRLFVMPALLVASLLVGCGPKEEGPAPAEMAAQRPAKPEATASSTVAATATPEAAAEKVFECGNVYGIRAGGKAPTFTLAKNAKVTSVSTYHYVEGGGPVPGTLGLKGKDGTVYGPWPCKGVDGQGGVKNAFWIAEPNAAVPAGTYTIVDSDPASWSTNDRAKGLGFSTVWAAYE
jgi:hypothetical protein